MASVTKIYVVGSPVEVGSGLYASHLEVHADFLDDKNNIIRRGFSVNQGIDENGNFDPYTGTFEIFNGDDGNGYTILPGNRFETNDRLARELNLGDRNPEDVWLVMSRVTNDIKSLNIPYHALPELNSGRYNSNSFVNTLLHSVGVDLDNYIDDLDFSWIDAGYPGHDTIIDREYEINGTAGDDKIHGYRQKDELHGFAGDDYLYGHGGQDKLYGGTENDRLFGGGGNDELYGDDGDDYLYGHGGQDKLYGGVKNDRLYGGSGNDELYGDEGSDVYIGGADFDTAFFFYGSGPIKFYTIENSPNLSIVRQGGDRNLLYSIEAVEGTDQDDRFTVSNFQNPISLIDGGDDADKGDLLSFSGATGTVMVTMLSEGAGFAIRSGKQVDFENIERLQGSEHGDLLTLGVDAVKTLDGAGGYDIADFSASTSGLSLDLIIRNVEEIIGTDFDDDFLSREGVEVIDGGEGDDRLRGGVNQEQLKGGAGDDVLLGHAENDTLIGGDDLDILLGGAGNDILQGDAGDDRLVGEAGIDIHIGGTGDDRFIFAGEGLEVTTLVLGSTPDTTDEAATLDVIRDEDGGSIWLDGLIIEGTFGALTAIDVVDTVITQPSVYESDAVEIRPGVWAVLKSDGSYLREAKIEHPAVVQETRDRYDFEDQFEYFVYGGLLADGSESPVLFYQDKGSSTLVAIAAPTLPIFDPNATFDPLLPPPGPPAPGSPVDPGSNIGDNLVELLLNPPGRNLSSFDFEQATGSRDVAYFAIEDFSNGDFGINLEFVTEDLSF